MQREREKETKHPEIVRPQTALHRTALRLRGLGEKKKKKIERREMDLLKAIKNGNAEEVRSIIEKKGASIVSQTSKKGEIPLLEAGFSLLFFLFFFFHVCDFQLKAFRVCKTVLLDSEEIVQILLENGADVNVKDSKQDRTPICIFLFFCFFLFIPLFVFPRKLISPPCPPLQ